MKNVKQNEIIIDTLARAKGRKQKALIAAAPDMLAALEKAKADVYEAINKRANLSLVWHDLNAAIAKAKGEA